MAVVAPLPPVLFKLHGLSRSLWKLLAEAFGVFRVWREQRPRAFARFSSSGLALMRAFFKNQA